MPNKPFHTLNIQGPGYHYPVRITAGMRIEGLADELVITREDGKRMRFPRSEPDATPQPIPVSGYRLTATAEGETPLSDGTRAWTAMPGSTVTAVAERIQWMGQPGDAPPKVVGPDGAEIIGLFTEANRVGSI